MRRGKPLEDVLVGVMMSIVVAVAIILFYGYVCGWGELVSQDRAIRTFEQAGYHEITVTSKHGVMPHWRGGCDKNDAVAFKVTAVNPAGKNIRAVACCGAWIKNCTIRGID